jgi:hypothetical protein
VVPKTDGLQALVFMVIEGNAIDAPFDVGGKPALE